ncbi:MAG: hypothetical protein ACXVBW_06430 [Bdellovibrionota bacterium]
MKYLWLVCGSVAALTTLSIAMASPIKSRITDDTAIYQNLSEVRVSKEGPVNFDGDLDRLSAIEGRYSHEKLPSLASHPRLKGPMKRIAQQKYHYSGSTAKN